MPGACRTGRPQIAAWECGSMSNKKNQKNHKKINRQKKRQITAAVIAIILAVAMIVPLLVVTVSAAEVGTTEAGTAEAGTTEAGTAEAGTTEAGTAEDGATEGQTETTDDAVRNGITLNGVDLSGKSREEVQQTADDILAKLKNAVITLHGNTDDENVTVSAGNLGLSWSNEDVVDTIVNYGHAANIIARYKQEKDLEQNGAAFAVEVDFNQDQIRTFVENNCTVWDVAATDASMTRANGGFQYTEGSEGVSVNLDSSVQQIYQYLTTQWDGNDATVNLDMEVTEPSTTVEDLQKLTSVLGTFTTYYSTSNAARAKNISNACGMINGMSLAPGETFSMLKTITPFTEENGYQLAGSYSGDEVVESFGGGICQVSTTLYNAVIRAELQVNERYNHSMIVTYVDPSADAAIAESSGMDFRFTNNLDSPVYIEGYTYNGSITFTIYGVETRPANRKVSFVSETLSETPSEGTKIKEDPSQPVGSVQTTAGHTGYTARLWKVVTVDGVEKSRDVFNNSTYNMTPTYVKVGTAGNMTQELKDAIASQDVDAIKKAAADAAAGVDTSKSDDLTQKAQEAADAAYADALAQGLDTTTAMQKAQEAANAVVSGNAGTSSADASSAGAGASGAEESTDAGSSSDGTAGAGSGDAAGSADAAGGAQ